MLIDLLHKQIRTRYHRLGFKDGFVTSGRFTLHFYQRSVASSPDTLVLIHGLGTSASTWVHILSDIDPAWNIIAIDLPGFGFSMIESGEPFARLYEHVEAMAAVVNGKSTRPILLLGHSLGGWVAARFALEQPKSIRHLILADTAGILCEDTAEQGKAFQVNSVADLRRFLNKVWLSYPWYFRPFFRAVLSDMRKRGVTEFVQSIDERDFLNDRLRALAGKTTIVWGHQDGLISLKSVEVLKRILPETEVHLIERCGHVPQLERPNEFARVLRIIMEREMSTARISPVI